MRHGKAVDLASLYETYSDMLFRTALTYVSHTEDAQDIVHDVMVLHYLEGLSVEETASCLRISIPAAKMRLARGRQRLKELLGAEG